MSTVEEIEAAVRGLSATDQARLAQRLQNLLWEAWDLQIEEDAKAGRLDQVLAEVEADIAAGRTKPLDEILDNSQIPPGVRGLASGTPERRQEAVSALAR